MAEVNTCLKRTFTVFNVFFAVLGALLIVLTFQHQVLNNFHGGENVRTGVYGLYIGGSVMLVIATLGAYGAHRESKACLSVFLGCMVTGTLLMLIYGIPAAISRPLVEEMIENDMRSFVPVNKAPEEMRSMIDAIQTQVHCCGLFNYTDWGDGIPNSCRCSLMEEDKCQTVEYNGFFFTNSISIYAKTCFPFIIDSVRLIIDILICILFTLAGLAMLGMILSSVMIHQMCYTSRPTIVLKSLPPFIPAPPPKYEKLHEDPPAYC